MPLAAFSPCVGLGERGCYTSFPLPFFVVVWVCFRHGGRPGGWSRHRFVGEGSRLRPGPSESHWKGPQPASSLVRGLAPRGAGAPAGPAAHSAPAARHLRLGLSGLGSQGRTAATSGVGEFGRGPRSAVPLFRLSVFRRNGFRWSNMPVNNFWSFSCACCETILQCLRSLL